MSTIPLLDLIEGWARGAPERIAFRSAGQTMTYAELIRGANALAGWLLEQGGSAPQRIAIHGHKEPEMLVGFLGAWKAGRAYVPIDLSLPAQRVEGIIQAAGASIVLTPAKIAAVMAEGQRAPRRRVRAEDPCYLIFTSGSTGEPKGVLITHGNLNHFVEWMLEEQRFSTGTETFLNQANFSFDLSVMDLYLTLATGGTLVSLTHDETSSPARVLTALRGSGLTTWVSTPSFVRLALVNPEFSADFLPELRRFLFCGETLSHQTAAELRRRFPKAQVWNTYGPTETTVATTSILIDDEVLAAYPSLPVGRSMPGSRVLILGEDGAPVPEGTRGEIVIAGPNVSPGYLDSPQRNAEVFRRYEGEPAYHTGDWGCEREGLIFFEGRRDSQVKLHGYRIELGEIEEALQALPEVAGAVVIPVGREGNIDSLAAFIVSAERGPEDGESGLRAQLELRLPAYMVPAAFHFVASFPLTANGKADRAQLASLLVADWERPAADSPGRTLTAEELERDVAAIWRGALQVETVGPDDNFFELGGDSLRATCALLAIEKIFHKELPVAYLYQHPTLRQLIGALISNASTETHRSLITIQKGDSAAPLFWLPGATSSTTVLLGNASYIFRLARNLGSEQTVYSVYQEHLAVGAAPTIQTMAASLLEDILAVQPAGPYYLAGWSFGALLAFEIAQQLERAGRVVALVGIVDQTAPGYPRPRPWHERPAALWETWRQRSLVEKLTSSCSALARFLADETTLLIRKSRRALGQRNAWDRVIRLEDEYLHAPQWYPGPVTLFAGRETLAATRGSITMVHDENLGWSAVAGRVETHVVIGDHHTIFDEPGLTDITVVLSRHLRSTPADAVVV